MPNKSIEVWFPTLVPEEARDHRVPIWLIQVAASPECEEAKHDECRAEFSMDYDPHLWDLIPEEWLLDQYEEVVNFLCTCSCHPPIEDETFKGYASVL